MSQFIYLDEYSKDALQDFDGADVVVTPELVLFWKPPNPFGQWTDSPFEIDGHSWLCAEQYMMAEKARLFGDTTIHRKILESTSPRQHKKLGQQVSGFNEEQWAAERCDIVFRGNVAKFSQNEDLKSLLLETGDRQLVEASPLDRIWGIGFAADHPDAYAPDRWKGLNLLGKILEDVRAYLRQG